jgi:hypothetical protein
MSCLVASWGDCGFQGVTMTQVFRIISWTPGVVRVGKNTN